jgi:hypothetical protein
MAYQINGRQKAGFRGGLEFYFLKRGFLRSGQNLIGVFLGQCTALTQLNTQQKAMVYAFVPKIIGYGSPADVAYRCPTKGIGFQFEGT